MGDSREPITLDLIARQHDKGLVDGMEVRALASISTGNVSKADADRLNELATGNHDLWYAFQADDYGWTFWIPENDDARSYMLKDGLSEAFCDLLKEIRRRGCHFVKFDCDAPRMEGVPRYEW